MLTRNVVPSRSASARLAAFVAASWLTCLVTDAVAQANYGSFFTQQGLKHGGGLGTQSSTAYLYDKYFYHNTAVSPYVNLGRLDPAGTTSYYAYVKPEQERRAAAYQAQTTYIDQLKRSGRVGGIHYPGMSLGGTGQIQSGGASQRSAKPSAYYNHWYGGWNK